MAGANLTKPPMILQLFLRIIPKKVDKIKFTVKKRSEIHKNHFWYSKIS
jgi:hypothetical protein